MDKLREKLFDLIKANQIKSYKYNEGVLDSTNREVDRLVLEFPSGERLALSTFCSGFSEGSCFMLDEDE